MTDAASPTTHLSPRGREFLAALRFAVVASLDTDGSPHQAVAWYFVEGDEIIFNSAEGRHWPANLERDPRVSFAVEDGYDYVSVSGTVEIDRDQAQAQADIERLARRYHDDPATVERQVAAFRRQQRVSFRLRPARVYERFGD